MEDMVLRMLYVSLLDRMPTDTCMVTGIRVVIDDQDIQDLIGGTTDNGTQEMRKQYPSRRPSVGTTRDERR